MMSKTSLTRVVRVLVPSRMAWMPVVTVSVCGHSSFLHYFNAGVRPHGRWLQEPESNQHFQMQNLADYHYPILRYKSDPWPRPYKGQGSKRKEPYGSGAADGDRTHTSHIGLFQAVCPGVLNR